MEVTIYRIHTPSLWTRFDCEVVTKDVHFDISMVSKYLSMGKSSKSFFLTVAYLSDSGMASRTRRELDNHFVKRNPPFAISCRSCCTRVIATRSFSTDFKQSST